MNSGKSVGRTFLHRIAAVFAEPAAARPDVLTREVRS